MALPGGAKRKASVPIDASSARRPLIDAKVDAWMTQDWLCEARYALVKSPHILDLLCCAGPDASPKEDDHQEEALRQVTAAGSEGHLKYMK